MSRHIMMFIINRSKHFKLEFNGESTILVTINLESNAKSDGNDRSIRENMELERALKSEMFQEQMNNSSGAQNKTSPTS